jgi:hypothetical protein
MQSLVTHGTRRKTRKAATRQKEMTTRQKQREAKRLSTLHKGIRVKYEPTTEVKGLPGSMGNQFLVWLDEAVFDNGNLYCDARDAVNGDLTAAMIAAMQHSANQLQSHIDKLVERYSVDAKEVAAIVARELERGTA